MDFKVEGPWNTDTFVGRPEEFLNSRRSRMAKTLTFWPWWQSFNSFCFESLTFFPLFPLFLFATQKRGVAVAPGPSSIAGPVVTLWYKKDAEFKSFSIRSLLCGFKNIGFWYWKNSQRELASKMTQPGRNFFKYISYTVGTRILCRFQISTASNINLWGEEIMIINTDMGRTSKSHKLLKNLFSFLSETIAL